MNPDVFKELRKAVQQLGNVIQGANKFGEQLAQITNQIKALSEAFNQNMSPFLKSFSKMGTWFQELDRAGLTTNLGEKRSVQNLKQYQKLLSMGYAIFWVPRETVVNKLLDAKTESARKSVIVAAQNEVLEDCEKILNTSQGAHLRDARLHLKSAIDCAKAVNYRAAQSTAAVCFDSLLDQIIDTSSLSRFNQLAGKINGDTQNLKDIKRIPIQYLYAALQSQLVIYSLREFERLQPMTVRTKYSRHSSIHSVSARQYNRFNALQAIMITVSLLATTERLGKGWVTGLSNIA